MTNLNTPLIKTFAATLLLTLASTASATPGRHRGAPTAFIDEARVVSSTPVYEEFHEPRQECWTERVDYRYEAPQARSYGGAIIGSIVGGILGNQLGKGNGRTAATAVGAATGAIVGNNIENNDGYGRAERQPREVERCRSVDNWSRRISGYDVVYRYQGREYSTFLPYNPGERVRVNVSVNLAERW